MYERDLSESDIEITILDKWLPDYPSQSDYFKKKISPKIIEIAQEKNIAEINSPEGNIEVILANQNILRYIGEPILINRLIQGISPASHLFSGEPIGILEKDEETNKVRWLSADKTGPGPTNEEIYALLNNSFKEQGKIQALELKIIREALVEVINGNPNMIVFGLLVDLNGREGDEDTYTFMSAIASDDNDKYDVLTSQPSAMCQSWAARALYLLNNKGSQLKFNKKVIFEKKEYRKEYQLKVFALDPKVYFEEYLIEMSNQTGNNAVDKMIQNLLLKIDRSKNISGQHIDPFRALIDSQYTIAYALASHLGLSKLRRKNVYDLPVIPVK
jgi:hypothetical protein